MKELQTQQNNNTKSNPTQKPKPPRTPQKIYG